MADDPYYFDRVVPLATGVPEDPVHHDPEKHPYWGEYEETREEDLAWGNIIAQSLEER